MSSNFNCSYMARSSLTYIPCFSVKFFFQPIYTSGSKYVYSLSVKSTLGQNCQMLVSMKAKKTSWDKTAIFLSVCRLSSNFNCSYMARSSLTYIPCFSVKFFFQPIYTSGAPIIVSIYILDTIESESITRFKNRSSDRMMTSDWLVDVSDDRCTTSIYRLVITFRLSSVRQHFTF
jgi:hypothetical protein